MDLQGPGYLHSDTCFRCIIYVVLPFCKEKAFINIKRNDHNSESSLNCDYDAGDGTESSGIDRACLPQPWTAELWHMCCICHVWVKHRTSVLSYLISPHPLAKQTRRGHRQLLCKWGRNKRNPNLLLEFPMMVCDSAQDGAPVLPYKGHP
jgi:hypothetical protein